MILIVVCYTVLSRAQSFLFKNVKTMMYRKERNGRRNNIFYSIAIDSYRSIDPSLVESTSSSIATTFYFAAMSSHTSLSLFDILPWCINSPSVITICDTLESDGRFIAYHLARQALQEVAHHPVLWLHGGPLSEKLVVRSLKKLGSKGSNSDVSFCTVRCLAVELSTQFASGGDDEDHQGKETPTASGVLEDFIKGVYRQACDWRTAQDQISVPWIILDDVSTLAALVGEALVYSLVVSLSAVISGGCGLLIRCSGDGMMIARNEPQQDDQTIYFGAGGRQLVMNDSCWETALVELADYIIDVVPLAGGSTRDAHGRLLLTSMAATSTPSDNNIMTKTGIYNYCIHDTHVQAIRIRK